MGKFIYILVLLLVVLTACSNAKPENTYTIEDARQNEDVIVKHKSENFDQITQGALELENIQQITTLLEKVENKEEYKVDISLFSPDGSHYKNSLLFNGETITFENNYGGYKQSPKGTFTCEYIQKRGPIVYLSQCETEDGKEFSTLLGFIGTEEAFKAAAK